MSTVTLTSKSLLLSSCFPQENDLTLLGKGEARQWKGEGSVLPTVVCRALFSVAWIVCGGGGGGAGHSRLSPVMPSLVLVKGENEIPWKFKK